MDCIYQLRGIAQIVSISQSTLLVLYLSAKGYCTDCIYQLRGFA
jgi:hypothetical protein